MAKAQQPWFALYGDRPREVACRFDTALEMAEVTMREASDRPLVHYFDRHLTGADLDAQSDAFARALHARGFGHRDRLVAQTQNIPQFVVALLACWKLGGTLVTANPMYREREVALIVEDCRPQAFLTQEELWPEVGRLACSGSTVEQAYTTSMLDGLARVPDVLEGTTRRHFEDATDLAGAIAAHAHGAPVRHPLSGEDPAVLMYTSGTTGPPKGAMISHRNLLADVVLWPAWLGLTADDTIMAVAPVFHVTGLAANVGVSLLTGARLVLAARFDAAETLRQIEHHRATFLVAAITVYTALMNHPDFSAARVASLRAAYSGGAPVAPATASRWRQAAGVPVHNCYGLTETTSLTHLVPLGLEAPVDARSGALAIGIPASGTDVEIHDDAGVSLPPGEIGELVIGGPQVVSGYWERPQETAETFPDGRLRTGDVGFMDEQGWFYLVDRRKDLIVASGYKVWPREVEDVLVSHPSIREAAVIGVPDEYRGETVKAFVSLRPGASFDEAALVGFCKARMAAYKYPRSIEVLEDLPKTASGKILRRQLRHGGDDARTRDENGH